ncbi:hypothetical protein [Brevundimonas sp.]|uniref:hypothetical protein n=1 Tax=Brevundimonas sp. TaxID=1871086 RepID=UPI00289A2623|nr:hypothetical protein [Brevundimonas sp.]
MPKLAIRIGEVLESARFDLADEKACQAQMHEHLTANLSWPVEREPRLTPRDIPDFMIEGVAVEVKMKHQRPADIIRQLERYAKLPMVKALVLASNRPCNLPDSMNGKPVLCISLGKAWL